jgi:two-component system nitrogen regulation response regulator NtrX
MLQDRRWPGNVRELRNAVERLLILTPGAEVTADDVGRILPAERAIPVDAEELAEEAPAERTLAQFRDDAERAFIAARLRENHWNLAETARALGIPRSNLYNKIEKYGIDREE